MGHARRPCLLVPPTFTLRGPNSLTMGFSAMACDIQMHGPEMKQKETMSPLDVFKNLLDDSCLIPRTARVRV